MDPQINLFVRNGVDPEFYRANEGILVRLYGPIHPEAEDTFC